jgi:uncharacterized membrane protein
MGRRGAALAAVPPATAAAAGALPEPIPIARAAAAVPAPRPERAPPPAGGSRGIEQLVGGVWLQNVGSVLVLLGVFFLILWGYTTGRLGAGALVAAGVLLGLAFVWRGFRTARELPAFGHALIGIGLGIVYLSLYLGHFTLHVLARPVAFGLLILTSLATVALGLRQRAQTVAALGVLGAFLPQALAAWLPLRGFPMAPGSLLIYVAFVDGAVFVLAWRAAWGTLELMALLLTTVTWIWTFRSRLWSWPVEIGLAALYVAFALVLLPRLARPGARARPAELAVVTLAPLGFFAASWPFLAWAPRPATAILLLGMAVTHVLAALWVEPRRDEEDLWRPLIAAATLFLTAALQRALGTEATPMAWCVEGAVLVWIGVATGGAWLRACGQVVAALGAFALLARFVAGDPWEAGALPVFHAEGIRSLVAIAALIAVSVAMGRRGADPGRELVLARGWTIGVNLLLLVWTAREADHVARAFAGSGGRWSPPPTPGRSSWDGVRTIAAVTTSGAWAAQALILVGVGWARDSSFLRWAGLALFALPVLKFLLFDLQQVDVFWRFLTAVAVGGVLLAVSYVYQRRLRARPSPP